VIKHYPVCGVVYLSGCLHELLLASGKLSGSHHRTSPALNALSATGAFGKLFARRV
jgi:hypothetical protein